MASNGSDSPAREDVGWRDRDPPPGFDGNPECFKVFLRDLEIWQHETDVPVKKHGAKLLRVLSGSAKAVVNELEVSNILCEKGVENIVSCLKEYYQPHLEQTLPRAFEKAVYGEARKGRESFGEFILRQEAAFRSLAEEGVSLGDTVKGYILFRQAALTSAQEDMVNTWAAGNYDKKKIIQALRKLEKVQKDKPSGGKHYVVEEEESEESSEDYVYLEDGDLHEIYEEEELQDALSTYQQVRRAIKDQKVNRGYFQPSSSKSGAKSAGKGKEDKGRGKSGGRGLRVHVDVLKLRTRCARCGQIGHWAKECTNEPDGKGRSKGQSSQSEKVGFFQVGTVGEVHGTCGEDTMHAYHVTLKECFRKMVPQVVDKVAPGPGVEFSGLTAHSSLGVVDTAAQGGLIGKPALGRLQEELGGHGLKVRWLPKKAQARGIGGEAQVCGVVEIPVGIAGVCGVVEATVVDGEVPFLLSIKLLREVQAIVDVPQRRLVLQRFNKQSKLHDLPTGHIAVGITEFPPGGWRVPSDAAHACRSEDFKAFITDATPVFNYTFMSSAGITHEAVQSSCDGDLQQNVSYPSWGAGSIISGSWSGSRKAGSSRVGASDAQDLRPDVSGGGSRAGLKLARKWLLAWISLSCFLGQRGPTLGQVLQGTKQHRVLEQGNHLQGHDPEWGVHWSAEGQKSSRGGGLSVSTPQGEAHRCGELHAEGSGVPGMSGTLGGGSGGDAESAEQSHAGDGGEPGISLEGKCEGDGQEGGGRAATTSTAESGGTKVTWTAEGIGRGAQQRGATGSAQGGDGDAESHDGNRGRGREEASTVADGAAGCPRGTGGVFTEPDAVAISHCGGGAHQSGVQRSSTAASNDGSGDGDQGGDGTATTGQGKHQWADERRLDQWRGRALSKKERCYVMQEFAPHVLCIEDEQTWSLWTRLQLEDSEKEVHERRVALWAWIVGDDGVGQYVSGALPEWNGGTAIGIYEATGVWQDEGEWLEEEPRSLSRNSRRAIQRQLEKLIVAEVFSPPRVTLEAQKSGHSSAGAYDLVEGYDFRRKRDRNRCMQELRNGNPDLLIVCPPCGTFSILQGLSQDKKDPTVWALKVQEGKELLEFAMKLFRWQVHRGKLAIFEHPSTSRAWHEPSVTALLHRPDVWRVRADQCQYGLMVNGRPSKKPTDFMVTGEEIANHLQRRCCGAHEHQQLIGGLARVAQEYPAELCQAMINGAVAEMRRRQMHVYAEAEEENLNPVHVHVHDEADGAEVEADGAEVAEDERGVTEHDKRLLQKLHANLGHPPRDEFCRALRLARARTAVWQYVKHHFSCPICERHPRDRPARPATLPRCFAPCSTLGLDVVYFPGIDARGATPVLNMVDWGTGYQMLEPLSGTSSQEVWEKFNATWMRTFGMPEVVVLDQGREFTKDFATKVNESGAILKVIGARAPWQQGRTERHGGLAKELFVKVREELMPTDWSDWKMCIHAVEAAKNRLTNRSGFSPAQRQIGFNLRLPGSLGSDDVYDPSLLAGTATGEVARTLQARQAAMEAFVKHVHEEALSRARRARSRTNLNLQRGEVVYVYRVPLQRKRRATDAHLPEEDEGRRATWVGPGVVVLVEGANVWVSIRGELWKVASEQVRKATSEEQEAKELLQEDFEELHKTLVRGSSKRGFKDLTGMARPPADSQDHEDEVPLPPRSRARVEASGSRPLPEESSRTNPQDSSSTSSSTTSEEPGAEPVSPGAMRTDEIRQGIQSVVHNERLDGVPFGPLRPRADVRFRPYRDGRRLDVPGDDTDDEAEPGREQADLWVYDEARNVILRKHLNERTRKFVPSHRRGCPVPLKHLKAERVTVLHFEDGTTRTEKDYWRRGDAESTTVGGRVWCGYTEFKVTGNPVELTYMVKRGSDEVMENEIPPEEWEQWRVADGAEWAKVEATGAVRTMSVEESEDVVQQLHEAGLSSRVLPSRIVRRWKPAEQPGAPPSRKSRWCVRGDRDPDILELDRHAPTVTTATLSIVLQIAATKRWPASLGDLRNAFMQSDPLRRLQGRLFTKQPSGGLPGMDPRQIIEILAGTYGLGDAPAHWRRSLKKVLVELGLCQSALDPTVFKWYDGRHLGGLIVVEVDDLLMCGNPKFYEILEALQRRFKFGKFVKLQSEAEGAGFNGRRLKQKSDFGFEIDMTKFVTERLKTVSLDKGRSADPDSDATQAERDAMRAAVGSLTWASKEGRPDAAAASSLGASSLKSLKIRDILEINKAIKLVKDNHDLHIKVQPIDEERLAWGVVTDASYANASKSRSQGGHAVIAYDHEALKSGRGRCNLLHWRSGKINRVVNSTLSAETLSLSRGLGELGWTVTVYHELTDRYFDLKRWEKVMRERRTCAFASEQSEQRLRKNICVVDAKSLYDHLSKETLGVADDKRTAIEMQIIRQSMSETATQIRWVPHQLMLVDGLTKKGGNMLPLYSLLRSGQIKVLEDKKIFREL